MALTLRRFIPLFYGAMQRFLPIPPDFWPSASVALLWRVRSGLGWMAYIARPSACSTGRLRSAARRGRPAMGGRRRFTTVIGAPQHGH